MAERTESARYRSYLLRLWQAGEGEHPGWRASLEEARSGDQRTFATLEALFTFLDRQLAEPGARASPGSAAPPMAEDARDRSDRRGEATDDDS